MKSIKKLMRYSHKELFSEMMNRIENIEKEKKEIQEEYDKIKKCYEEEHIKRVRLEAEKAKKEKMCDGGYLYK